jgi:hypothetical protein
MLATATANSQTVIREPRLTSAQVGWLVLQVSLLAGMVLWQCLTDGEQMSKFWADETGRRLAFSGLLFAGVNFGLLMGGWLTLNRLAVTALKDRAVVQKVLAGILSVACFVCCYVPAFFIVLIGPAAVTIRSRLLES